MRDNKLMGMIPGSLGLMMLLSGLNAESNKFEGSLPESLGALQALFEFNVRNNMLSGSLPGALALLERIGGFDLSAGHTRKGSYYEGQKHFTPPKLFLELIYFTSISP